MAPKSPKAEAIAARTQQRRCRVVGGESVGREITMIRISTARILGLSAETRISTRLTTDPAEIGWRLRSMVRTTGSHTFPAESVPSRYR
jgi:hypothetical protein